MTFTRRGFFAGVFAGIGSTLGWRADLCRKPGSTTWADSKGRGPLCYRTTYVYNSRNPLASICGGPATAAGTRHTYSYDPKAAS
jgi:hypothetical protein